MKRQQPEVVPFSTVRHERPDDWLHLEALAVRAQAGTWTIPAHQHQSLHQFQVLDVGRCTATLDGRMVPLQGPVALMLPPKAVHGFAYEPGCSGRVVTVPSPHLMAALQGDAQLGDALGRIVLIESGSGPVADAAMAAMGQVMDRIACEFDQRQPGRQAALQALAVQLALLFLRHREGLQALSAESRREAARDTLVRRYLGLIEADLQQRRSVADYAAQLGVTADHLSKVCRTHSGHSALGLLHERLYLEACRLLVHTTLGVAEVAEALGFEDAAYFSRFFSRHAGCSPMAHRLATRAVADDQLLLGPAPLPARQAA